jgi:hypothetical protein
MRRAVRGTDLLGTERLTAMYACPLADLAVDKRAVLGAGKPDLHGGHQLVNLTGLTSTFEDAHFIHHPDTDNTRP